jgi:ketosteroid isomerase-like protein
MSERYVELARRLIEAFNARDLEAYVALCDPSIEWHSTFSAVSGTVYQGHDGLRRWHRDLEDAWGKEIRIEPEAYFDLGEHTLAFNILHGRGRQSRADVAMPYAAVSRWRDDLIVYAKSYVHREDALSDLDVSEDALEPIPP